MQTQLSNVYSILTGAATPAVGQLGIGGFVLLLSVALASSLLSSYLYLTFYASRATGSRLDRRSSMI